MESISDGMFCVRAWGMNGDEVIWRVGWSENPYRGHFRIFCPVTCLGFEYLPTYKTLHYVHGIPWKSWSNQLLILYNGNQRQATANLNTPLSKM